MNTISRKQTPPGEQTPLDEVRVGDRERLSRRARRTSCSGGCARSVRSTGPSGITEYPDEDGFWSVTTADDVFEVSRDWQTFSSELGGFTALKNAILPLELQQAMFIGMDPPKHDRLKALFQRGFTPKRIAEHEDAIRAITIDVLDRLDGREHCDLVTDVAQPVGVARDRQLHGPAARGRRGVGEPDERDRRRRRPGRDARGRPERDGARRARRCSSAAAS